MNAPYALDAPELSFALSSDLEEISGLTTLPDGRLAAVQDEDGILFILNPETGAVELREDFGDAADYEGIAWAGDRLFVVRSNGQLFEITGWPEGSPSVEVHRTALRGRNNVEGLAYDREHNRLLLACKDDAGAGLGKDVKAIYAYDLGAYQLLEEPVYVLDVGALDERFDLRRPFKPSGLAIHPLTGELFVLSATAGALAQVGDGGEVEHLWPLSEDLFEQPEAITFLSDGTLFIASEAVGGPPMLYRFPYNSL